VYCFVLPCHPRSCKGEMLAFQFFILFCVADGLLAVKQTQSYAVHLFANGTREMEKAFEQIYGHFENNFDFKLYEDLLEKFQGGVAQYHDSDAYTSYEHFPSRPHCDKGVPTPAGIKASSATEVAAFPGGITKRLFGFDFSKSLLDLSSKAKGPAAAGLVAPVALATTGLTMGAGLVQSIVAAVLDIVPPLIPPPIWNNQPLICAPMITGHNCFGAVLYPITMADFTLADVTDSMLDGYIAGFPNTYATKVGKTSDEMYKACFSSYMSMMCSSIFPRCTTPQSRDEPIPVGGRVPICLHLCIMPLVMCPGFWISDLIGQCSMVSVPPMCTQAFYWNLWRLPPQYVSFDDANPYPKECPPAAGEASDDLKLYDDMPLPASPIESQAAAIVKLPAVA